MFEVTTNIAARRVTFRIADILLPEEGERLAAELREAALHFKSVCGGFDMFADMTEAKVMGQESAKMGEGIMAWCLSQGMRKSATLTVAALMTMQAKRVVPFPNHRVFISRDEALAWLDETD